MKQYIQVFVEVDPKDLENAVNGWLEQNEEHYEIIGRDFSLGNGEYGVIITFTDKVKTSKK